MKRIAILLLACTGLAASGAEQKMDIAKIDPNFRIPTVQGHKVQYYDVLKSPEFRIDGFASRKPGEPLYRLPAEARTPDMPGGVLWVAHQTSGGAVRFRTDSPIVAIKADMRKREGSRNNFDFYEVRNHRYRLLRMFQPTPEQCQSGKAECLLFKRSRAMRTFQLNLPIYNGIQSLEIGVAPGSKFETPTPYRYEKPLIFYGSSITQGAAASRPGCTFCTMLCMALDAPQYNLGFSGKAKGEIALARVIGKIPAAAVIIDYDFNAPTTEHLKKTHEPFFLAIRQQQPQVPVIILSRYSTPARIAVIRGTYENAVKRGDKNVYYLHIPDGLSSVKEPAAATYDNCHPNDLGFYLNYRQILPVLKKAVNHRE